MTKAILALSSDLTKTEHLNLKTHHMNFVERFWHGTRGALIYIVLAVMALAIPGLHLLLTPVFLFAAAYRFVDEFLEEVALDKTQFKCLDCGQAFVLKHETLQWPLYVDCPHCQAHYRMDPED